MKSFEFSKSTFATIFTDLHRNYSLFGPKRIAGKGRFSDSDLITYANLSSAKELELAEKSYFSPKAIVFPADETTFHFTENQFSEPDLEKDSDVVVFLRPCDINGIARLDKMFLENGGIIDPYYQRRRNRIHFFMIECRTSFENCFCVSMKSNVSENYAAALRFDGAKVSVQVKDERFLPYFSNKGANSDFTPQFVQTDDKPVELPSNEDMPLEIFSDKMWEEYDARCIACGRCNTSCVTCSCFSTVDIFYPDSRKCGERRRVWDGCHLDGFTDMAGDHSLRKNKGERMRFKTLHKIYDFRKRFGFDMCVGCGRCDDVCPEYISFSSCINKLSKKLQGGRNDEK